jgi:hypothetical protein
MPMLAQSSAVERHSQTYLQWWQVMDIAEQTGITLKQARLLLDKDSGARKYLPKRSRPLYIRRVVLRLFGLLEENSPA